MYSREERTRLRQEFWIKFGQYMKPVPSAEGLPINWINYKTGVKHVLFKMDATQESARIFIELTHSDRDLRLECYEKFLSLEGLFLNELNEKWVWEMDTINEFGQELSVISITLPKVNIFNKAHWPQIISFFKERIVSLDRFWADVKPMFES